MLLAERQQAIISYLAKKGFVSVAELCQMFSISEMTVRRDLTDLEKQGLLQRTYGGAIPSEPAFYEVSSRAKSSQFVEEKDRIGKNAADMVSDGEVVFLDAGTTTLQVARYLKNKSITIVTNDLNIVSQLLDCRNINIYLVGGNLRRGSNSLIGPKANSFFDDIRGDKLFLAVEGIDDKAGLTVPDMDEVTLKRKMVDSSSQTIVVADHSKLGRNTMGMIAPLSAVNIIITDKGAPDKLVETLKEHTQIILT